jgi:hypothetical protein
VITPFKRVRKKKKKGTRRDERDERDERDDERMMKGMMCTLSKSMRILRSGKETETTKRQRGVDEKVLGVRKKDRVCHGRGSLHEPAV